MSKTLSRDFQEAQDKLNHLLAELQRLIRSLPDNPDIHTRLSDQAFTISSKNLGKNWTPVHHDFREQYRLVSDALETGNAAHALEKLRRIIADQQVPVPRYRHGVALAPGVVENLKTLMGEE